MHCGVSLSRLCIGVAQQSWFSKPVYTDEVQCYIRVIVGVSDNWFQTYSFLAQKLTYAGWPESTYLLFKINQNNVNQ